MSDAMNTYKIFPINLKGNKNKNLRIHTKLTYSMSWINDTL